MITTHVIQVLFTILDFDKGLVHKEPLRLTFLTASFAGEGALLLLLRLAAPGLDLAQAGGLNRISSSSCASSESKWRIDAAGSAGRQVAWQSGCCNTCQGRTFTAWQLCNCSFSD